MTSAPEYLDLADERDAADLVTLLRRARRLGSTAVRLQASGRVLAVTICALAGSGLMGEGTVLGMRVVMLADEAAGDLTVGLDDLLLRLTSVQGAVDDAQSQGFSSPGSEAGAQGDAAPADPGSRGSVRLSVPVAPVVEAWSGMSAPRSGWAPVGLLPGADVEQLATEGIAEVAAAGGDPRVRDAVWRRPIPGTSVPAGAAFALHGLGFTAPEIPLHTNGRWARLSTPAGYVLSR
ncbi:hypothetical protein [Mobilicoccus pelagius]|uniref:Uncharacterized protein n=1 Tax=Mobilicoccus pelagius NBRC 104925 TaxID=1089455 RepID=H5UVC3_9MICO|nr:hypothetical protein [Mobilicoccus pelagius]GAB49681.1 hypothetical protein MOPEL_132_00480 [Mobilicoccus pelagius NBRC 104925]